MESVNKNTKGWIILSLFLAIALVIFIIMWAFSAHQQYKKPDPYIKCFGGFGSQPGTDGIVVNLCGISNKEPCIFARNTLADSQDQCNILKSICNSFTFNFNTSTMKIVQSANTFISPSSNLFVRQS